MPMRPCLIAAIAVIISFSSPAQVGNEWIRHNQHYFKISVAGTGIFRLTFENLVAAGFPPSAAPATLQLFHRGEEQAIYVEGEADGHFDPGDFIDFYGTKNDGVLDAGLYHEPSSQPHAFYNLFSDTTHYFLTCGSYPGKRMPVSSAGSTGAGPETFHWEQKLMVLTDQYAPGMDYGNVVKTVFDLGEGWTGTQIVQGQHASYVIADISNTVESAALPVLEILLTGRGDMDHAVEIYAGTRLLSTLNFSGYQSLKHVETLAWTDLEGSGKLVIDVRVGGGAGRVSVGYIGLRYPARWDMASAAQKIFTTRPNPQGSSHLRIENAPAGTRLFDVTDPGNVSRIEAAHAGTLDAVVMSAASRKILAVSAVSFPAVRRVTFRLIDPRAHNFIMITHPSLRRPASGYTDPVKAYAEYRALPAGGSYDTLVVNITDLYDQFCFGEQSPLAIYNFMRFLATVRLPDYLFLIGKGLDVSYGYYRNPGAFTTHRDLVPSAGYPASDILFTAGLSGVEHVPGVATGRLSASTPQDVAAYLNKVKETEARPFDDLRRKDILHLSGGIFEGEPQLFRSYLAGFAATAGSYYLGGKVTAIAKQATDLEVINVADELNKGLNLITFFGHSGPTTTDFDIGNVTDPALGYRNRGKYPLLLMNGCSTGSFFLNGSILGENWVNAPDRGAIGVVAHSDLGFAFALRNYSTIFYQTAFADSVFINRGLGDVQQEVAGRFLGHYGDGPVEITQAQQMVLLADPSIRIFAAPAPDYEISEENISVTSFNGDVVTALTDSFRLNIVVRNFGQARPKPVKVRIARRLDDHSSLYYESIADVLYSDTLTMTIPAAAGGAGNNMFEVIIDADDEIHELDEENNRASFEFFIPLSGTGNLYPANYAIVGTRQVSLVFQHTDMLSGTRLFTLELDTADTFDSPFKKQFQIEGKGLMAGPVGLLAKDSLAYYWRTRLVDPSGMDSIVWDQSTFTYISDGGEGWAQVHFPQFARNSLEGLVADPEIRVRNFEETTTGVTLRTFGSAAGNPPDSVSLKIGGAEYNIRSDFTCRDNTINLVAFDRKTAHPYPGLYFTWQDLAYLYEGKTLICGREPFVINSYRADELVMDNNGDLMHYVDNIPEGDSVILFNIGDAGYTAWPSEAKAKLGELGIAMDQIDALVAGEPVIIFARKGASAGSARLHKTTATPADVQELASNATVTGRVSAGRMTSELIGPAQEWKGFFPRYAKADDADAVHFDIIGVSSDGKEQVLINDVTGDTSLASVNAGIYPFIKVVFKAVDEVLVTAPALVTWIVAFEEVPEGVLLYRGAPGPGDVSEGETWTGDYAFVNISNKAFPDSLGVAFRISNPQTFASTESSLRIMAPLPADTVAFRIPFTTLDQEGMNSLEVFVNPGLSRELDYNNNIIFLHEHLRVSGDGRNPVLDVTFDGRHIANDELVSSSPRIRVMLWDNNPHRLKKDTSGITVLLSYPCDAAECPYEQIHFSRSDVSWQPETDTSEFAAYFNPAALPEGRYTLRAEGSDANANPAGPEPYIISFRVEDDQEVVMHPAFPNPFYYQAVFDFEVGGDSPPSAVILEVMDLAGKPVYQDGHSGAGNYHAGSNSIKWAGLDNNGNPVAGGIYFYRLAVRLGEKVTSATGKLVLVR